jgi:hypothetical protein
VSEFALLESGSSNRRGGKRSAGIGTASRLGEAQIVYVRCMKSISTRAALHEVKSMLEDFMASKGARVVRWEMTAGTVTAFATHKKKPPLGIRFKACKFLGYEIRVAYVVPSAKP